MIIDFHTHIFPPVFRDKRESFFSEEPAFKSLYGSPRAKLIGMEELLECMDEDGIDRSVVFGFPWEKEEHFKRHNDYIIEAVHRHPNRFTGFCCFSPFSPSGPGETERCLASGLKGVGELALYGSDLTPQIVDQLREVMSVCLLYNLPFMLHTNEPVGHNYAGKAPMTLARIYAFLKAYPDNHIVLAHWGGGILFYALMKKEVREVMKNVWFDTAASPFLYTPEIYRIAVEIIGENRILLGSDYPLIRPGRYLKEVASAGISPRAMEFISGLNAAGLLHLSPY
jgi:predicted TIM-barrel fold metal-dependent hydrolase